MRYDKLVAPDTFIGEYMAYMSEQETATEYDFWCACWLLSTAVGRSVVVDRPRAPVFLNLYAILVANSGVTRKSAAVGVARGLARELLEDDPMLGFIESKTLPEQLERILHDRSITVGSGGAAIAVSELATFLGTESYNAHMPALLTDLYDCPASRRGGGTISRGPTLLSDVFVNFLSASTPAWLIRSVNPNVVEGGFTSRCIFVHSEHPKRRIAWPENTVTTTRPLLDRLRVIRTLGRDYRKITISDPALAGFRKWYSSRKLHVDPFRSSFESREDSHVLRIAAFLSINDNSWNIQYTHLSTAIKIIAVVKDQAALLFEGGPQSTKWIMGFSKLQECFMRAGLEPTSKAALFLKVRGTLNNAEFVALLEVMTEMSYVQRYSIPHEGRGRPGDVYRGTNLLTTKGALERVVQVIER